MKVFEKMTKNKPLLCLLPPASLFPVSHRNQFTLSGNPWQVQHIIFPYYLPIATIQIHLANRSIVTIDI
jgi:hypothetical protein